MKKFRLLELNTFILVFIALKLIEAQTTKSQTKFKQNHASRQPRNRFPLNLTNTVEEQDVDYSKSTGIFTRGSDLDKNDILKQRINRFSKYIDRATGKQVVLFIENSNDLSLSDTLFLSNNKTLFPLGKDDGIPVPKCIRDDFIESIYYCKNPRIDGRDETKNILSNFYLKQLVDKAYSLKIVFLIHRNEATFEGLKSFINNAARHFNNESFLSNSVALAVAGYNEQELAGINYDNETSNIKKNLREVIEIHSSVPNFRKLGSALLSDSNRKIGLLSLESNKVSITSDTNISSLIHRNISFFVNHNSLNISFPLSSVLINKLNSLIENLESALNEDINDFNSQLSNYFLKNFSASGDVENLVRFKRYRKRLEFSDFFGGSPSTFVELINQKLSNLNIPVFHDRSLLDSISNSNSLLQFFKSYHSIRESENLLAGDSLQKRFKEGFYKTLTKIVKFLEFSNDVLNCSSSYTTQSFIPSDGFASCRDQKSMFDCATKILNDLPSANSECDSKFKKGSIYLKQLKKSDAFIADVMNIKLKALFKYTFERSSILPDRVDTKKLIVRGRFVFLKNIEPYLKNYTSVEIFALEKIFMNTRIQIKSKEKLHYSIIAPVWETVPGFENSILGIILYGHSVKDSFPAKANNGSSGLNGKNGTNGHDGYPGGNIFGIVDKVVNIYPTVVLLKSLGGAGEKGQDGGNGGNGNYSEYELANINNTNWQPQHKSQCKEEVKYILSQKVHYRKKNVCKFKSYCTNGANGGFGGSGGQGGSGGKVLIVPLSSGQKFTALSLNGQDGAKGTGGSAGIGGKSFVSNYVLREGVDQRQDIENVESNCADGSVGYDGIDHNLDSINRINETFLTSPARIIYSFKQYARSLDYEIRESHLSRFLSHIYDNEEIVQKIEGATYIAEEFTDLNDQFRKDHRQIDGEKGTIVSHYLSLYSNLLKRIKRYDKFLKNNKNETDERKVVDFLQVAVLGEICRLQRRSADYLIVNLSKALENEKEKISDFETQKWRESALESFDKYKKSFLFKIEGARDLIQKLVKVDLKSILDQLDVEIRVFLEEVQKRREEVVKQKHDLNLKKQKIENTITTRYLLSSVALMGNFIMLMGPVGIAGGALLTGGATILEGLTNNKIDDPNSKITTFSTIFSPSLTQMKSEIDYVKLQWADQLERFKLDTKKFEKEEGQPIIDEMFQRVQKLNKELKEDLSQEEKLQPAVVKKMRYNIKKVNDLEDQLNKLDLNLKPAEYKDLKQELEKRKEIIKKEPDVLAGSKTLREKVDSLTHYRERRNDEFNELEAMVKNKNLHHTRAARYLSRVQTTLSVPSDLVANYWLRIAYDEASKDRVDDSVQYAALQIQKADQFLHDVRIMLATSFAELEELLKDINEKPEEKSQAKLIVMRSVAVRTISDFRTRVQQMAKTFPNESTFIASVSKIEEVIKTMIDLYDQIEKYKNAIDLAELLKNVATPQKFEIPKITGSNEELRKAADRLRLHILNNVIILRYDALFDAFKQYAFPYADYYLSNTKELLSLENEDDDSKLAKEAASGILKMIEIVKEENTAIIPELHNSYKEHHQFDGSESENPIYYAWEFEEIERVKRNFFNGTSITLHADVSRSPEGNHAIKFNTANLRVVFLNEKLQKEFDTAFSSFDVVATHLGNNYYRCGKNFYRIDTPRQELRYSFDKSGKMKKYNSYERLETSHALLSPYCTWTFSLKPQPGSTVTHRVLDKFANKKIRLELVGQGSFVNSEYEACKNTDKLDLYYRRKD